MSAVVFVGLLFVACGGSDAPPEPANEAPTQVDAPAAEPEATPAAAPVAKAEAGPVGKLVSLQNGDAACYVVIQGSAGEASYPGDFDLCGPEGEALVGKDVQLRLETGTVMAATCEGDPACTDTEEVQQVKELVPQ